MGLYECKIHKKQYLSKDQFILTLESKEISTNCKPGQFVNVQCDSLLKRPISIFSADRENGLFSIAIRIKGSGTSYLEKQNVGDLISVLGPLGNGFDFSGLRDCVVVGGGIGIYPLMFVLQEARKLGITTTSVCGFRSIEDSFLIDDIKSLSDKVVFASECGEMDFCGNAVDALSTIDFKDNSTIFTCGPSPMMQSVSNVATKKNIPCQVSLEQRMGCGTGICLVCACKIKYGDDFTYKRCCKEGPVFDHREVIWD